MELWIWVGFILFVLAMLALDLGVFNRKPHVVSFREAMTWSAVWVSLALVFNVLIYFMYEHHWLGVGTRIGHELDGKTAAIDFFAGYLIEKSLSLDNILVIAIIFRYFRIPLMYQHRVLFWGVLGALVMRGVMIAAGVALLRQFSWMTYVFGVLLLLSAAKLLVTEHSEMNPDRNLLVRFLRRLYPISSQLDGSRFFTQLDGRRAATPLMLALVIVESSDVMFAIDSIPAIFAITDDPLIVFTSNIFAILGLRSLYFALAGMIERFVYLETALVFVLGYVGVKLLLQHHFKIPTWVSLVVIAGMLTIGIAASLMRLKPRQGHM